MTSANDAIITVTDQGSEVISDRKKNTLHLRLDLVVSKLMNETNRLAPSINYKLMKGVLTSVVIAFRSKLK